MTRSELYDWWSRNLWALRGLYGFVFLGREKAFRHRSIAALDLDSGDSVLELGCGPGNSFERIRAAVGEDGTVVGVDYSRGMVQRAAARIDEAGWDNVHVVRADATAPGIAPGSFDAVYAAMSLSAMPDPAAAVEAAAASLTLGGHFAILDARPFQKMPLSLCNPVLNPAFKRFTNWRPEIDIPSAIASAFESSSVRSYHLGSIYIACGTNPQSPSESTTTE